LVKLNLTTEEKFAMEKTVLITGGAGYIGSHIAYVLACNGYRVIVLDKLIYGQSFDHKWATLIKGDFADELLLDDIFTRYNIQAVIHCAASIEVGESVKNPIAFYQNNVAKTITLLDVMLKHQVKTIIFSSSCAVFGTPLRLPLTEDHPFDPVSPYGRTKYMMEMIIKDMEKAYGFSYVILRFFNAAGALPHEGLGELHIPETHLIPLILRAAHEQQSCTIFGNNRPTPDGSCVRDFVHVLDIAQAHLLSLRYLEAGNPSDIFNLGTGNGVSVKHMINTVERITGKNIAVTIAADRPGDPAMLVADPSKANKILGWAPIYSGIDNIIDTANLFMYRYQLSPRLT
jgi:UDP-glucose 4-epimerase